MFKKDDVVICVDVVDCLNKLTLNNEYVVQEDSNDPFIRVISDSGKENGFCISRFVLKEAAVPKPAEKPKRVVKPKRKPGEFFVGDLVIINSNDKKDEFWPTDEYKKYVGNAILKVIRIEKREEFSRLYLDAPRLAGCFVDSRQCSLALRKNGQPRVLRKKAVPKSTATKVIKALDEKCAKIAYNCCSYARVEANGTVDYSINAACYANLNYAENLLNGKKGLFINLSAHHRNHPNKAVYEKWVEYILYRSHFRKAFKKSKSKTPWLTSLEMDISYSHSYLITCAIALREGHEYYQNLEVWNDLVVKGYSEDIAWFMSGFIQKNGGKYSPYPASAHTIRHYQMGYKSLLSVLLNDVLPDILDAKPYSEPDGKRYQVYTTLVPGHVVNTANNVYKEFTEGIPAKEIGAGWNKKSVIEFKDICLFADKVIKDLAKLNQKKVDHPAVMHYQVELV